MAKFKPSLLTLALMAATTANVAYAAEEQESDSNKAENDVEVIEIKGFRRSVIESMNTKRYSGTVIESVSAEDIGKLPDSSIAESIARLPGITAQRLDGRASKVSIRGFGENESATTFNGREQLSINDNRGVEFDLYPSEIMSGVDVYKTPDATIEAEGIAGVVNMKTVRPLSKDRTMMVNGQYEMTSFDKLNPDGDDTGARASFAYIDQFADNTLGLAIAATTMSSPNQEERWNAWGARDIGLISSWGAAVDANGVASDSDRVLEGAKPFVRSSTLERDSVMGVLEYAPNDRLSIIADALYVDFSDQKILRGIEIPAVWADGSTVVNSVEDGIVTSATITNEPVVRNDYEIREAEMTSFGLNVDYTLTDTINVNFDMSLASVERQIWSMESYSGTGRGSGIGAQDTITYVTDPSLEGVVFNPSIDYSDWNAIQLGGPLSWGNGVTVPSDGQDGFLNTPEVEADLLTLKLAASKMIDSDFISSIDFGVSYKDREKTKVSEGYYLTLKDYPNTITVPEQYRVGTADLSFFGMGEMIAYDSRALVADGYYDLTSESLTLNKHLTKSWTVQEEVLAAFVQANIDMELGDFPLTGNIGLRYLSNTQSSQGTGNFPAGDGTFNTVPTDIEHDFDAVLPTLNLKLEINEEQSLRLGVAKTISRPRLDEMNASVNVDYNVNSTNGIYWNISGGNPYLEPKEAIGIDLTYENYFSEEGYFSIALYRKDLENWIFDGTQIIDFSGTPAPDGSAALGNLAQISGKVNGGEGSLTGWEVSVTYPFKEISEALDGLGIIASYSGVESDISDPDGNEFELPGLSDSIQNVTVYYEKNGFQARASMRKRSDFKGDIYTIGFDTEQFDIRGETIIDAQIGFDFGEAGFTDLDGLSVFLQAQNITDEPFVTEAEGVVRDYQSYGSTYLLGFSYKF